MCWSELVGGHPGYIRIARPGAQEGKFNKRLSHKIVCRLELVGGHPGYIRIARPVAQEGNF